MKAELLLDHTEGMLDLGADLSFGRLEQILHPPIRGVRTSPARAEPYRHSELRSLASHLLSLGDALVTGVAINHLIVTMQQIGSWREVMYVGSRDGD